MLRFSECASCLAVAVAAVVAGLGLGCGGDPPPVAAGWTVVAPEETARARAILIDAAPPDIDPGAIGDVPLQAVTGLAVAPGGVIVAGVSPAEDRFWEAWLVPGDGSPPRPLAPLDNLVSVDAGGAVWVSVVSEDEAGNAVHEMRLSPVDGSPSRPLSPDLPASFAAEQAVPDGDGGRLLVGSETLADGRRHAAVFAAAPDGTARRIAWDARPGALVLAAALAPEALYVEVLYGADEPAAIAKVCRSP